MSPVLNLQCQVVQNRVNTSSSSSSVSTLNVPKTSQSETVNHLGVNITHAKSLNRQCMGTREWLEEHLIFESKQLKLRQMV